VHSSFPSSTEARRFATVLCVLSTLRVSDADLNPAPMHLKIKGKMTLVGGNNSKAPINWKTGVYLDDAGEQQQRLVSSRRPFLFYCMIPVSYE